MARNFNIVANLQLRGPGNIRSIVNNVQKAINSINANVNLNIATGTGTKLNSLNANLGRINATLINISNNASNAASQLNALAAALGAVRTAGTALKPTITIYQKMGQHIASATDNMHAFGEQAALAVRRFAAFAGPTAIIFGLVTAMKEGFSAAFEFEKEMIRLSQVTGKSVGALGDLSGEITRLATSLGTSSKDLGNVATTLAQAGLSAKDTKVALEALARSSLAATFTDIESTTEGAIAVFRQFGVRAADLQGIIGSLNAVSAQFAVESDDLVSVIRRTGGAFKAAGGSLDELLGLFTAVRSTTRESADSIATGFRTIFTRIQRPRTIQYLKELGINLNDVNNRFTGPLDAIRKLNAALSNIESNDPRFAAIIEELGGFRQVSKVIPLIQQFPEALKAITVAQEGQLSIVEDSEIAQKSLANQTTKVKEEFLALFREISGDKSFRAFAETSLDLAKALIEIARNLKPLIPLLSSLAVLQIGKGAPSFASGFLSGLGRTKKFAKGGVVPGNGNRDTVPAMLTPGEFVLRKNVAESIGKDKLNKFNKFAKGGLAVDRPNKHRNPSKAESKLLDKAIKLPGVAQFGIASLQPFGQKFNDSATVPFNIEGKTFAQDVQVLASGLSKGFANKAESYIEKNLIGTSISVARRLLGDVGAAAPNEANAQSIVRKANFSGAIGSIFESALGVAGAPYDDKPTENFPIDFPGGIGDNLAAKFGIPVKIPTDATRTYGSKGKSFTKFKGQIKRFLQQTKKGDPFVQSLLTPSAKAAPTGIPTGNIAASLASLKAGDVSKLRSTFLEGRRVGGGVDSILKKMGVSKAQFKEYAASNPFAKGGPAGEDTVPAMLTPGEFVFNKKTVKKLGLSNLKDLNNNRVKKFAKGGPVGPKTGGGGGVSGNGIFIGLAAMSAFTSTLDTLDDSTKKVLQEFGALAASIATISFLVSGLGDQKKIDKATKLGSALTFDFANPGRSAKVQRRLGLSNTQAALARTSGTLAKNFEKVAIASAVVSAAFNVIGDRYKEQGKQLANNAKSFKDLGEAISADNKGSLLKGVGTGAGAGAAIGTVIAPGIGTLIGTAAGAVIGVAISPFFKDTAALLKTFKQNQFNAVSDELQELFTNLNEGRSEINASGAGIAKNLSAQRTNVLTAADPEQAASLLKQFRSEVTNIRTFSTRLAESSATIADFENALGGAGKEVITSLSFLTKKTYPEVRKAIEKEIESIVESRKEAEIFAAKMRDFKKVTVGVAAFGEAVQQSADKLAQLAPMVDLLTENIQGGTSAGKFTGTGGVSSSFFERAGAGSVLDDSLIKSNLKQITSGLLDGDSADNISKSILEVSQAARSIPAILARTASKAGLVGDDNDDVESIFRDELRNAGIGKEVATLLESAFASQVASRTGTGDSGFKQEFRKDPQAIIDKLLTVIGPENLKQLDSAVKTFQDQVDTLGANVAAANKLQLDVIKKRVDLERTALEFEGNLLRDGKKVSIERTRAAFSAQQGAVLGGTGIANNVPAITAALKESIKVRGGLETERQAAPFAEQGKFVEAIGAANERIGKLRTALEGLASSTLVLTRLQDELAKEEENRKATRGLLEEGIFGSGSDRAGFFKAMQSISAINAGKTNLASLPAERRKLTLDFIKKLPDRELPGLGGKTPDGFILEELKKGGLDRAKLEGAGDFEALFGLAKAGGAREEPLLSAIREEQTKMFAAQTALNGIASSQLLELQKLNSTTIAGFKDGVVEAVKAIGFASAGTRAETLRNNINDKSVVGKSFGNLASILRPGAAGLDFTKPGNAGQGDAIFKQAKKITAFTKEIEDAKASQAELNRLNSFQASNTTTSSAGFLSSIKDKENKTFMSNGRKFFPAQSNSISAREGTSGLVKDFIDRNELNKIFGDIPDLQQRLMQSFTQDLNGIILNPDDPTLNTGSIGFKSSGTTEFSNEGQLNAAIQKSLSQALLKIKNEQLNISSVKAGKAVKTLDSNLGADVTKTVLEGNNLEKITENVTLLSKEFAGIVDPAARLTEQIKNLRLELQAAVDAQKGFAPAAVPGKARGGLINGRGTSTSDSILARLSRGEYVVKASTVNKLGVGALEHMNETGTLPGFAGGGRPSRQVILAQRKKRFEAIRQARKEAFEENRAGRKADFARGRVARVPRDKGLPFSPFISFSPDSVKPKLDALGAGKLAGLRMAAARKEPRRSRTRGKGFISYSPDGSVRGPKKFAAGGPVPGMGAGDKVPAMLTPGEFVLNRGAANAVGLGTLHNFNKKYAGKYAKGGVVNSAGPINSGGGTVSLTLGPEALAALSDFNKQFSGSASNLTSAMTAFASTGQTLSSALTSWNSSAGKLAEAMLSMPSEIKVTHSPILVTANISGMEGLEKAIQDKVLAAVDARMSSQTARAADGKNPFLTSKP